MNILTPVQLQEKVRALSEEQLHHVRQKSLHESLGHAFSSIREAQLSVNSFTNLLLKLSIQTVDELTELDAPFVRYLRRLKVTTDAEASIPMLSAEGFRKLADSTVLPIEISLLGELCAGTDFIEAYEEEQSTNADLVFLEQLFGDAAPQRNNFDWFAFSLFLVVRPHAIDTLHTSFRPRSTVTDTSRLSAAVTADNFAYLQEVSTAFSTWRVADFRSWLRNIEDICFAAANARDALAKLKLLSLLFSASGIKKRSATYLENRVLQWFIKQAYIPRACFENATRFQKLVEAGLLPLETKIQDVTFLCDSMSASCSYSRRW